MQCYHKHQLLYLTPNPYQPQIQPTQKRVTIMLTNINQQNLPQLHFLQIQKSHTKYKKKRTHVGGRHTHP